MFHLFLNRLRSAGNQTWICLSVFLAITVSGCASRGSIEDTSPVLVSVKDVVMTRNDYEAALSVVPKAKREQMSPSLKQSMLFIENAMIFRVLANEAREMGLDKDPVLHKEIVLAEERLLGLKRLSAFEAALKRPDFLAAAKEQYEVKKDKYTVPEAIKATHILIKLEGRSDSEAMKLAEEVRKKALAGEDFTELAMKYSDDSSKAQNKGTLGFFGRGQMVAPFETAAFALKTPGEISTLVKTQFGYHVIRLDEKRIAQQKPFDDVKAEIMQEIEAQFVTDARNMYISKIKTDPSIVIHEKAIEALNK
jgi:peptidyl-prolyl cis-trans isomerase C